MAKNIASAIRIKQAQAGETLSRKLTIEKEYNKVKSDSLNVFKFVADIAAATIIGKRVIVPCIATPLAAKVKVKMEEYEKKHHPERFRNVDTTPKEQEPLPVDEGDKLDITTHNTNLLKRYYNYH